MAMAVDLIKIGVLMAYEFHHPFKILVLVISAIKFQLAVTTDKNQWWAVLSNPIEWGILVDGGL